MKKIILLSCIILGSLKADTLFLDLHDVVLQKKKFNGKKIKHLSMKEQYAWLLASAPADKRDVIHKEFMTLIKKPSTWAKIVYALTYLLKWKKEKIVENYLSYICGSDYENFSKAFLHFMNEIYEENPAMINLLQRVKDEGHTLRMLSNMGGRIFQDAKTTNAFPHLFDGSLFASPENSINSQIPDAIPAQSFIIPTSTVKQNPGYYTVWKPMKAAYDKALAVAHADAKNSWMVDDKEENNPQKFGWKGFLRFSTVEQFEADLEKKGLLKTRKSL